MKYVFHVHVYELRVMRSYDVEADDEHQALQSALNQAADRPDGPFVAVDTPRMALLAGVSRGDA